MSYILWSQSSRITLLRFLNESEVKDCPSQMDPSLFSSTSYHVHPRPWGTVAQSGIDSMIEEDESVNPIKTNIVGGRRGQLLFSSTSWVTKLPKQLWMVKGNFMFDNIYCTFTSTWYNMVQQMAGQGLSKSPPLSMKFQSECEAFEMKQKSALDRPLLSHKGLFELFKKGPVLCTSCHLSMFTSKYFGLYSSSFLTVFSFTGREVFFHLRQCSGIFVGCIQTWQSPPWKGKT